MQNSIDNMSTVQNSMNSMQAISFIGKQVNGGGNTINYTAGSSSTIDYNVGSNAADVVVKINNSSGTTVRTVDLKNVPAGDNTYTSDAPPTAAQRSAPAHIRSQSVPRIRVEALSPPLRTRAVRSRV